MPLLISLHAHRLELQPGECLKDKDMQMTVVVKNKGDIPLSTFLNIYIFLSYTQKFKKSQHFNAHVHTHTSTHKHFIILSLIMFVLFFS